MQRAAAELPYLEGGIARAVGVAFSVAILAGCGSTGFALTGATVDGTHMCAIGSTNASYDIDAKISADNSTSKSVDVRSIDAVLVVSAVHGQWQQPVGTRYDAGKVPFSPGSVGAGSKATLTARIPSACTNGQHQGTNDNYADYSIQLSVATSAGTYHVTSSNKHRILAP
jgi:hypothetical protein